MKDTSRPVELRRELGLFSAVSYVVGITIGSGIFISPKPVLQATGSAGLCLTVWLLAGAVQMGSALCYAELATMLPVSGGAYTYVRTAFGNFLAFTHAMRLILFYNPGSNVVTMLTFSRYFLALVAPGCSSNPLLERLVTMVLLMSMFALSAHSTRMAARVANATTVAKLLALAVIIGGGLLTLLGLTSLSSSLHDTSGLTDGFQGTSNDPSSLALALYAASFAYSGSENLNVVVEEVKNPSWTLPRACVLGVLIVTAVNTLANVSYLAVLTRSEMLSSQAVAVDWGERLMPGAPWLVPLSVCLSALGSSLMALQADSRLIFAAARDGNVPQALCFIQVHNLTPLCAMIATAVMCAVLVFPSDIISLINYLGFLRAAFEACVFASLIAFRLKPDLLKSRDSRFSSPEASSSINTTPELKPSSCDHISKLTPSLASERHTVAQQPDDQVSNPTPPLCDNTAKQSSQSPKPPSIKLPLALPITLMVVQLYMFLAPLVISPRVEYFYAALTLFGGSAILYRLFVCRRTEPTWYMAAVRKMQILLQVCPPTSVSGD